MWTSPRGQFSALSESYWINYRNSLLSSKALLSPYLSHWVKLESPLLPFAASVELYSRKNKTAFTKKGRLKLKWEKEGDSEKYHDLETVLKDIKFGFERAQTGTQLTQVFHSFGGDSSHRCSELGAGKLWCLHCIVRTTSPPFARCWYPPSGLGDTSEQCWTKCSQRRTHTTQGSLHTSAFHSE